MKRVTGRLRMKKHVPKAEMQVQREENVAAMITVDLEDLLRLARSCHVNKKFCTRIDSNPKLNVDLAPVVTG